MKLHIQHAGASLTMLLLAAFLAAPLLIAAVSNSAYGQIASASGSFSLQGKLTNINGTAIADGQHSIKVNVYQRGNATPVYSESDTATTYGGVFNVLVGSGHGSALTLDATSNYEVGIGLDLGTEMQPHITLASSPRAITSSVSDSSMVAGIALNIAPGAHGVVTSINGVQGAVDLLGGGNIAVTTTGNTIGLTFTGSAGGLLLPFTQALPTALGGLFNITNTGLGNAATFSNTGLGGALVARDSVGTAISAFSKGLAPTIDATNSGGVAINALSTVNAAITATTNSNVSPAIIVKNTASAGPVELFQALNSTGAPVLDLATTGMKLTAPAATSADAVLRLQNTTSLGGNLLAAVDNTGAAIFTVGSTGTATLRNTMLVASDTGGMAISATTTNAAGPVLRVQNISTAAQASLIAAVNGFANTVFSVAGNGVTNVSASTVGTTALVVSNLGGAAISATGNISNGAVLQVLNGSGAGTAALIAAKDSVGNSILNVAVNGATQLRSTAATALDVATTAVGGTGAKISGGLTLTGLGGVGPAGTATILTGQTSVTVTNAYAKTTSIVLATINSAITTLIPIRVSATSSGSFTVSVLGAVATASDLVFNYLIINTQ